MATKYLQDTNVCIDLLRGDAVIRKRVEAAGPQNCRISEITLAELYYGAEKSTRTAEKIEDIGLLLRLFDIVTVLPGLQIYGACKIRLEQEGQRLDEFDLLIGASAIAENLILVTDNTRHLGRLPGIVLENWSSRQA